MNSGPDHVSIRKNLMKKTMTDICENRHTASRELNNKDPRKDITGIVASHCPHQSIINVIGMLSRIAYLLICIIYTM